MGRPSLTYKPSEGGFIELKIRVDVTKDEAITLQTGGLETSTQISDALLEYVELDSSEALGKLVSEIAESPEAYMETVTITRYKSVMKDITGRLQVLEEARAARLLSEDQPDEGDEIEEEDDSSEPDETEDESDETTRRRTRGRSSKARRGRKV